MFAGAVTWRGIALGSKAHSMRWDLKQQCSTTSRERAAFGRAGCKTGVEVYFDDNLGELAEMYPELAAAVDGRDKVVNFTWGGNYAEGGTAFALAAALATLGDAIIYDPQEDICLPAAQSAEEARQLFQLAKVEGYRARDE
jgi:hypothetical protein